MAGFIVMDIYPPLSRGKYPAIAPGGFPGEFQWVRDNQGNPDAWLSGIAWRIWLMRRIRYPLGAHFLRVRRILHVNMRLAV